MNLYYFEARQFDNLKEKEKIMHMQHFWTEKKWTMTILELIRAWTCHSISRQGDERFLGPQYSSVFLWIQFCVFRLEYAGTLLLHISTSKKVCFRWTREKGDES